MNINEAEKYWIATTMIMIPLFIISLVVTAFTGMYLELCITLFCIDLFVAYGGLILMLTIKFNEDKTVENNEKSKIN